MRIKYRSSGILKATTRPKRGEYSHEDIVRNPKKFRGLRLRFRTHLKAPSGFKYRTELLRRPACLGVLVRKGDIEEFKRYIEERCPGMKFEGWDIMVRGT
jgi:hypothetical protein